MPQPDLLGEDRLWDVAVLGAGMGGSFAAYALAKAGHSVLLVEYGNETLAPAGTELGGDEAERRLTENRWPTISAIEVDGVVKRSFFPFGSGVGGSTNLYAAALERFDTPDIDNDPAVPHPTQGWPIRYSELLPYYEEAERLLHVVGEQDPLGYKKGRHIASPPPLGPCDADFFSFFEALGLHPYRLHVGIRYRPGCNECLSSVCRNHCRADARSVLTESSCRPTILARTELIKLEATAERVTRAVVQRDHEQFEIRAKAFILAAGAIHTPKVLLQSSNEHWPHGLANKSGLVGRNLMFHAAQNFALWPKKKMPCTGPRKSLAVRDFYQIDQERLGTIQSSGLEVEYGLLLVHFYESFNRSRWRRFRFLRPFLRIPAAFITRLHGSGWIFACIIEDMPYPENRVVLDENEADGVLIRYTIKQELRDRTNRLRQMIQRRLKGRRLVYLSRDVELNFGHPCGTCAMSDDPATGVIDRDCRAHGIENLFIADASFMPTSASTNPSLTVAANALRVADKVSLRLKDAATAIPQLLQQ